MRDRRLRSRALVAALALSLLPGCSSSPADTSATTAGVPNVRLTKAQRSRIQLHTVVPLAYRRRIEAPGTVDFDNDQSTSVVSPFTGPVVRTLVSLGQPVSKGQPLALIQSADYATAIAAYRKAAVTAANARRLAVADRDLAAHNGISQREETQAQTDAASAEADRLAALQTLLSLGVDRGTVARALAGSPVAGVAAVIRAPVSGIVVEKQITPGQLLQAGSTAAFTVANLSQLWVLAQIAPSDLSAVGIHDPATIDPETALGHSMARSTISPPRSTKTLARSWRASSCPIPPTCSRSKCTSTSRLNPGASAQACLCRSRQCCATMRTYRSSMSVWQTAACPAARDARVSR